MLWLLPGLKWVVSHGAHLDREQNSLMGWRTSIHGTQLVISFYCLSAVQLNVVKWSSQWQIGKERKIEYFSIEWRNANIKVIITTNHRTQNIARSKPTRTQNENEQPALSPY